MVSKNGIKNYKQALVQHNGHSISFYLKTVDILYGKGNVV